MSNIYCLKASELDQQFIERLKSEFGDRQIQITISELDETEYLLASEANRTRLLQAVENVQQPEHRVEVSWEQLA
ncbi:MAG: hypothetical protein F6J87_14150 [Spirulina sp. SIO3F2]|nr:hypothetical protein [Spirulina sp. SIO3F2]